jgi:hypothetical protein
MRGGIANRGSARRVDAAQHPEGVGGAVGRNCRIRAVLVRGIRLPVLSVRDQTLEFCIRYIYFFMVLLLLLPFLVILITHPML